MKKLLLFLFLVVLASFAVFWRLENKHQPKNAALKIQGVILPHHTLAKDILNNSFIKLKEKINPDTIVIYGTNHYFPVSETYTTTSKIKDEYSLDNILANDARVSGDHSIQTILLYIYQYFPNSKVIPILVSTKYKDIDDLNNNVKKFINAFGSQKTLYIASVDFAHNVSLEEGLNKNKESINNISNFNYGEILNYQDDHLDSPIAITTFLLTMKDLNATSWQLWYSSHGALITNLLNSEGTSYVVGAFAN
jgi:AmmeMemoRadiSam system protein B